MTDATSFPKGTLVEGHRILGVAGEGRNGKVYEATFNRQPRALKLMYVGPAGSSDRAARGQQESETCASIDHVNIARFYATGFLGDFIWLSTEFVQGWTYREYLNRARGRPPLQEVVRAMAQACDGLAAIHRHGIVHRDIKPENLMLTLSGDIKIIDFGFAKPGHSDLKTTLGKLVGTAVFMPPEVFAGNPLGQPGDVYALGVILYESLTGENPMGPLDQSLGAVAARHQRGRLPRLRSVISEVPSDLADWVDSAVDPNPLHRPAADKLAEGLHRVSDRLHVEHRRMAQNLPIRTPRDAAKVPTVPMAQVAAELAPPADSPVRGAASTAACTGDLHALESFPRTAECAKAVNAVMSVVPPSNAASEGDPRHRPPPQVSAVVTRPVPAPRTLASAVGMPELFPRATPGPLADPHQCPPPQVSSVATRPVPAPQTLASAVDRPELLPRVNPGPLADPHQCPSPQVSSVVTRPVPAPRTLAATVDMPGLFPRVNPGPLADPHQCPPPQVCSVATRLVPAPRTLAATVDMPELLPRVNPWPLAVPKEMPDLLVRAPFGTDSSVSAENYPSHPPVSGSMAPPSPARRRAGAAVAIVFGATVVAAGAWVRGRSVLAPTGNTASATGAGSAPSGASEVPAALPARSEPPAVASGEGAGAADGGELPGPMVSASSSSHAGPIPSFSPTHRPYAPPPMVPTSSLPLAPPQAPHRLFGADR